jgi:prepilin-type N-terminal cleavage/methylation domain-containing protein
VQRSRSARAGYTILELLVVVMIGGVMAKLSMGKIHDLMSHQRVLHAATAVQNDLEAAFQIAGRNRAPVRIAWDATVMQLSITDRAGTLTFRKTNLSRQAYGFASNAVTVSTSPLEVYPNGLAADTLLVTISSNGFTKKLRMSRAGLVQAR